MNKKADNLQEELISWRRSIHKNPELAFNETDTSGFITTKLKEFGIEYKKMSGTGVVGLIRGGKEGKTLAIRADIDGLAITEKNDVDYKSQNEGVMHACGHDGHTSILLGTAKLLSEMRKNIKGNIKLIFQPAEEGPGGAKPMIEEGVLENPKVDYIIGLHINPDIKAGKVGIKKGRMLAAPDYFEIKVKGKGTHGARPEEGVDPITIGSQIVMGLQQIKSREVDALKPLVISCGSFHSGNAFNAIPEEAVIKGTVRSFDNELRKKIKKRMHEIIENITNAYRADYDFKYNFVYPPGYNDPELTSVMGEVIKEKLGENNFYEIPKPSMGGDDFAYLSQKVPGTYMRLGTKNKDKGIVNSLHSPYFDLDEEILKQGVKLFAHGANRILNKGY
ncbi:MAG: amidohydrolase [Halanaerobiales bacterium]|nr:amidohydrolase [Halanaerobiales bacterium]